MPFRVFIKHPDGHMEDRIVTTNMDEAEAHFAHLCERRTPAPAVAILHPPVPELGERRYRLDATFPDELREDPPPARRGTP